MPVADPLLSPKPHSIADFRSNHRAGRMLFPTSHVYLVKWLGRGSTPSSKSRDFRGLFSRETIPKVRLQ